MKIDNEIGRVRALSLESPWQKLQKVWLTIVTPPFAFTCFLYHLWNNVVPEYNTNNLCSKIRGLTISMLYEIIQKMGFVWCMGRVHPTIRRGEPHPGTVEDNRDCNYIIRPQFGSIRKYYRGYECGYV